MKQFALPLLQKDRTSVVLSWPDKPVRIGQRLYDPPKLGASPWPAARVSRSPCSVKELTGLVLLGEGRPGGTMAQT